MIDVPLTTELAIPVARSSGAILKPSAWLAHQRGNRCHQARHVAPFVVELPLAELTRRLDDGLGTVEPPGSDCRPQLVAGRQSD